MEYFLSGNFTKEELGIYNTETLMCAFFVVFAFVLYFEII